jgi:hypothetical protein
MNYTATISDPQKPDAVKGKPVIVVEHVTRLRGDLRPDWAQPAVPGGSYRLEPQRRPQLRGHPRGGRPDRERHP